MLLAILLSFSSIKPANASGEYWYDGNYVYRKSHNLLNQSGAGTNYALELHIINGSSADSGNNVYINNKTRTDFADVRFTQSDGLTPLAYANVTQPILQTNITLFVRIPNNLTTTNVTIYLYYDYPSAADGSTPFQVFPLFDNFDDSSLDSTWTFNSTNGYGTKDNYTETTNLNLQHLANDYCHMHSSNITNCGSNFEMTIRANTTTNGEASWGPTLVIWFNDYDFFQILMNIGAAKWAACSDKAGTRASPSDAGTSATNTWYWMRIRMNSTGVACWYSANTQLSSPWTLFWSATNGANWVFNSSLLYTFGHGYEGSSGSYPGKHFDNGVTVGAKQNDVWDDAFARTYIDADASIHNSWGAETPGQANLAEFQAPSTIFPDDYVFVNGTVNCMVGIAYLVNATLHLTVSSDSVVLMWINSTNIFSLHSDTNGNCQLNATDSIRTTVNATAFKLSWSVRFYSNMTEGYVNVNSTYTIASTTNYQVSSGSVSNLFYYEHDHTVISRFTFFPSNPLVNENIQFNGTYSITTKVISSYSWNFGDTTSNTTSLEPVKSYGSANTFTVTLTITTADGFNQFSQVIVVSSDTSYIIASFTWSPKKDRKSVV